MNNITKIFYGNFKDEYIDEVKIDKDGYFYGKYIKDNTTTKHFKTIDELLSVYDIFNYIYVGNDTKKEKIKNIEEELEQFGRILTNDDVYGEPYYSDLPDADDVNIKTIKYKNDIYYYKKVTSYFNSKTERIINKSVVTIKKLN